MNRHRIFAKKNIVWVILIIIVLIIIYFMIKRMANHTVAQRMDEFMQNSGVEENKDIVFKTDKKELFLNIYRDGNLALGEAYMAGKWDTPNLYHLFRKIIQIKNSMGYQNGRMKKILNLFMGKQANSLEMIDNHYNLGNDFFQSWLDKHMQYSCAYWEKPGMTLDEAQIAKMNLIGRKLKLKPGMKVLDMGCGWGLLSQYLAKTFDVSVVGINLSVEHLKYANDKLKQTNLPVKYILGDFAEINNYGVKFDRILSVGFYEHVTDDRYEEFYQIMHNNLKDDGIALLHTIGTDSSPKDTDRWVRKYIFTRGQIPKMNSIITYAEDAGFIVEDFHNFGLDYGDTLLAWLERFEKSDCKMERGIFFYRMWKYYLSMFAAAFHERELLLWQFVFTKKTHLTRYTGER